jgi:hypothetical protein
MVARPPHPVTALWSVNSIDELKSPMATHRDKILFDIPKVTNAQSSKRINATLQVSVESFLRSPRSSLPRSRRVHIGAYVFLEQLDKRRKAMKCIITYNERSAGSALDYEQAQKRVLQLFTKLKFP